MYQRYWYKTVVRNWNAINLLGTSGSDRDCWEQGRIGFADVQSMSRKVIFLTTYSQMGSMNGSDSSGYDDNTEREWPRQDNIASVHADGIHGALIPWLRDSLPWPRESVKRYDFSGL